MLLTATNSGSRGFLCVASSELQHHHSVGGGRPSPSVSALRLGAEVDRWRQHRQSTRRGSSIGLGSGNVAE